MNDFYHYGMTEICSKASCYTTYNVIYTAMFCYTTMYSHLIHSSLSIIAKL